nr:immunoglobulin light chain junction region [Macaca mulatta]MPN98194.1 immunoglobulin light chain junction region [Macaca mulatta]
YQQHSNWPQLTF